MTVSEAQSEAQKRYASQTKAYHLRLRKDKDSDVIDWLESQENVTGAIRDLVKRELEAKDPHYPIPSAYIDNDYGLHLVVREGRRMVYAHTFPRGTYDKGQARHQELVDMYTGCDAWPDWDGNDLLDPTVTTEDVEPRFRESLYDTLQMRYTVDLRAACDEFGRVLYATDSREDAEEFVRSYDLRGIWEHDDRKEKGRLIGRKVVYMLVLTEWGEDGRAIGADCWKQYGRLDHFCR